MIHIPILRHGVPYKSLDVIRIPHHRTRATFAEMSQANGGIIRRDLRDETQAEARLALAKIPFEQLLEICKRAADHFLTDTLPLGDDQQTPDDYVQQLSATTGMPHALVRRNMGKIAGVMTEMRTVLRGLTRSLDLSILDAGHGEHGGHSLSFYPRTQSLGVVLPSNSPGVHSLWVPAIALKTPLVLKPGSAEPWSPFRIAQAFMRAGSIADNGGRSCVNASGVWVSESHAERVARAIAERLVKIVPRGADDQEAGLAPFADPRVAERISQQIDAGLATPGARDITAELRQGPRLVEFDGCTYLLPTVVLCESSEHPLANREFLFPFAAVVKVTAEEMQRMPDPMGKTLVVSALTQDRALIDRLLL